MSKKNISKYDKQDIQNVGVVSLAIRPNQPSQYGVGSLSGKQLQERFDLLATSAIDKLNKVIDILNGSEITEYLSLGSNYAYGDEQKSVKDFIEDVYSATDGLITDDPATFESKKAISALVQEFYDAINALEAFTEIADYDAEKKLSDVYAKITALNEHNEATSAHLDIRQAINTAQTALNKHNTDEDAHEDNREDLNNLGASLDNYAKKEEVADSISLHNTNADAHNDLRLQLKQFIDQVNTLLDSDETTLDQMSEVVAYIKNNKNLIDGITTSKVNVADIINNLTTNDDKKPLSASMGVLLREEINKRIKTADIIDNLTTDDPTKVLSAAQGKFLMDKATEVGEEISKKISALEANKVKKEINNDTVKKLYMAKEKSGGDGLIACKSGYDKKTDASRMSIPLRFGANSSHPGTFEIEHPVMDSSKSGYSEKHPVTVKVLKEYVDENGSGGDGSGFVTKKEFEAFKEELTYEPIRIQQFSVSGGSTFEIGSTVTTITLIWYINKTPTELKLNGEVITGDSKTLSGNWSSDYVWNLSASDGKKTDNATASIKFCHRVYYGTSNSESIAESTIKSFDSELRSTNKSSLSIYANAGEYIYYCTPYGPCRFIDADNSFDYSFEDPEFVSVTNAYGKTENYYVYRSTNAIKGQANITIREG